MNRLREMAEKRRLLDSSVMQGPVRANQPTPETLPQFFDRLTQLAMDFTVNIPRAKEWEHSALSNRLRTFVSHTHVLKLEAERDPDMRSLSVIRSSWEVVKTIGAEFRFFEDFRDKPELKRELIQFLNSGVDPESG